MPAYHFIAGLPRSGSTLLAGILRQNPAFRAAMSSPVFPVFNAALSAMGGSNEFAVFFQPEQKARILRGILDGYYGADTGAKAVFDTNRLWTARLPALRTLYPDSRLVACVRNPAWIIDSIETLVRRNALDASRLFGTEGERLSVYARAAALMDKSRLVGASYLALKEAYYSQDAAAMLILDYDTLVAQPKDAIALLYQFLRMPSFPHDFSQVTYQAEVFDTQLLAKGLHDVSGPVAPRPRPTVLPPDLFQKYAAMDFWTRRDSRAHFITRSEPAG